MGADSDDDSVRLLQSQFFLKKKSGKLETSRTRVELDWKFGIGLLNVNGNSTLLG
jgi:hypothetical protein